ncbi:hypothetical protein H2199_008606 [Coniosporium tulheliwenetii]|uniref:Uncharacterized protein n=1 Tax=Coniosporium tulheliwenetii TaxID=3383036 RepID=A0ACC2YIV2_9PEZI|nr:hypothetical protein H2199_008606 [Cladosporium sp. JES 115]
MDNFSTASSTAAGPTQQPYQQPAGARSQEFNPSRSQLYFPADPSPEPSEGPPPTQPVATPKDPRVAEAKEPDYGSTVVNWARSFASNISTAAALGASLTFTVIVSEIADPEGLRGEPSREPGATEANFERRESARFFLAVGWLLFVVAFGLALVLSLAIEFDSSTWIASYNKHDRSRANREEGTNWVEVIITLSSLVLQLHVLAAFLFLGLAVKEYVEPVGRAAVGLTAAFGVGAILAWVAQVLRVAPKLERGGVVDQLVALAYKL